MLSTYIKELIESNNRIIIPDFGAFMIQDSPDGKQITFNDFLKFNDGLLINQIIKAEKISKNQATDKVKEFIKAIELAFSKKTPFEVKGLGFLLKDDNGNIKFDAKLTTGKAPIAATDEKPTIVLDEKVTPKQEEKKMTEPKKDEKPVAPKKEAVKAAPIPPKPTATKTQAAPAAKKPEAPKKTFEKKYATKPEADNSKLINIGIIVLAAIIILGGGTWAAISFDIFGSEKPAPIVEQVIEPIVDSSFVDSDTIAEEPKVIEEPTETIDPNQKYYHIVAGSFKVPSNAERFNQKLINEGYDSEIVIRNNGYHTVSYKTVTEWNDALTEWRKSRNTNSESWILIRKGK